MKHLEMRAMLFTSLMVATSMAQADPCDHIDRRLTSERKSELARSLAGQLDARTIDVLQSYRSGAWTIVYVDTHEADPAFLFFAGDPLKSHYIALWSGAARLDEEQVILDWTNKNVPRIPAPLAQCFAWHVSKSRDM